MQFYFKFAKVYKIIQYFVSTDIKICIKALFVFVTFLLLIYFLYFCTRFVKIVTE